MQIVSKLIQPDSVAATKTCRLPDRLLRLLAIAISGSVGVVAHRRRGLWTECRIVALLARSWVLGGGDDDVIGRRSRRQIRPCGRPGPRT